MNSHLVSKFRRTILKHVFLFNILILGVWTLSFGVDLNLMLLSFALGTITYSLYLFVAYFRINKSLTLGCFLNIWKDSANRNQIENNPAFPNNWKCIEKSESHMELETSFSLINSGEKISLTLKDGKMDQVISRSKFVFPIFDSGKNVFNELSLGELGNHPSTL